ncbi:hypothetical protein [Streptomyces sp. MUM 136J]|nr:hypothetical protein [Streptomyces sp. MUM 136J]
MDVNAPVPYDGEHGHRAAGHVGPKGADESPDTVPVAFDAFT